MASKVKRAAGFAQAGLYIVIVIAILVAINFLANRYNKSFDATSNKRFTLSDQTKKVATESKDPITINYWDVPDGFTSAKDLLDRYKNVSSKITINYQDIDKNRVAAIAEGVKQRGTIFVQVGNKKETAKSVTEEEITGAMVRALKGGDRLVCFTAGYGESETTETKPDGYANVKDLTEKNNYKTQVVTLIPTPNIPKECTILVVGGPRHDYLQPAVDAVKGYVEGGGHALIMLDPPLKFGSAIDDNAALVGVLQGWGVKLHKDLVLDLSGVGQLLGLGPQFPIVMKYPQQAIVREMRSVPTGFPITQSLETTKVDGTTVEDVLSTTDAAVTTQDLSSKDVKIDESKKGPRTLAVAGTRTTPDKGRFVVVGTSRWISNNFLAFDGNRDLYMNMLNWLSSDEDLIAIRPKDPEDRRLNMNQSQVSLLFYSSVVALPLLMLFAGISVWWRRR
ncbi:MAG: GldG family protein [Acidobacteriota bacterium]